MFVAIKSSLTIENQRDIDFEHKHDIFARYIIRHSKTFNGEVIGNCKVALLESNQYDITHTFTFIKETCTVEEVITPNGRNNYYVSSPHCHGMYHLIGQKYLRLRILSRDQKIDKSAASLKKSQHQGGYLCFKRNVLWIRIGLRSEGGGCKFHIFYFIALLKEKDDERKLLQRII